MSGAGRGHERLRAVRGWAPAGLVGAALVVGLTALIASDLDEEALPTSVPSNREPSAIEPEGPTAEPGTPRSSEPREGYGPPGAAVRDSASRERLPLLLVPGWFDTDRDMAALRIRFVAAGWPSDHVHAISFHDPTGSNRAHAEQIDSAVTRLLERTAAPAIDVVAHSMGGLATRWYLRLRPRPPVRRVAFLASPHEGTLSAHFAWGEGGDDMLPESAFLDSLNAGPPLPEGVAAITVRTPIDTHVIPPESATLPGVRDHLVCCPTHDGLLRDLEVFRIVHEFLEGDGPGRE